MQFDFEKINRSEKISDQPPRTRLLLDNWTISERDREKALIDPRELLWERVMTVRGLKSDTRFEVWIIWSCKTLKNRKWIMATSLPDNTLYELTYNGETGQFYLDEYEKVSNTVMNAVVPEDLV